MNEWTQKTLNLVKTRPYLDMLMNIYPATLTARELLPKDILQLIVSLYKQNKRKELVELLLDLKAYPFPIEHPYASLLRHLNKTVRKQVLLNNPKLIEILSNLLFNLGLDKILSGIQRPPDINRQMGPAFQNWLKGFFSQKHYAIFSKDLSTCPEDKICFLDGRDEEIGCYITRNLGITMENEKFERDLLVRVGNIYVVGEARFLSTPGGSQTRDLDKTITFVEKVMELGREDFIAIALIDGIVWYHRPYVNEILKRAKDNIVIMSALLLEDFLLHIFEYQSP